mmetsp:Transcript_19815/g.41108  ORF Transcript_19815/g.41108 Transcript_19815/m.41108 type:complete len:591 (-) Transcript_19815:1341-3113(-)
MSHQATRRIDRQPQELRGHHPHSPIGRGRKIPSVLPRSFHQQRRGMGGRMTPHRHQLNECREGVPRFARRISLLPQNGLDNDGIFRVIPCSRSFRPAILILLVFLPRPRIDGLAKLEIHLPTNILVPRRLGGTAEHPTEPRVGFRSPRGDGNGGGRFLVKFAKDAEGGVRRGGTVRWGVDLVARVTGGFGEKGLGFFDGGGWFGWAAGGVGGAFGVFCGRSGMGRAMRGFRVRRRRHDMRRRFRFRLSTVNRRGDGTGRLQGPRFGGAGGLRAKDGGAFFVVVVVVVVGFFPAHLFVPRQIQRLGSENRIRHLRGGGAHAGTDIPDLQLGHPTGIRNIVGDGQRLRHREVSRKEKFENRPSHGVFDAEQFSVRGFVVVSAEGRRGVWQEILFGHRHDVAKVVQHHGSSDGSGLQMGKSEVAVATIAPRDVVPTAAPREIVQQTSLLVHLVEEAHPTPFLGADRDAGAAFQGAASASDVGEISRQEVGADVDFDGMQRAQSVVVIIVVVNIVGGEGGGGKGSSHQFRSQFGMSPTNEADDVLPVVFRGGGRMNVGMRATKASMDLGIGQEEIRGVGDETGDRGIDGFGEGR